MAIARGIAGEVGASAEEGPHLTELVADNPPKMFSACATTSSPFDLWVDTLLANPPYVVAVHATNLVTFECMSIPSFYQVGHVWNLLTRLDV